MIGYYYDIFNYSIHQLNKTKRVKEIFLGLTSTSQSQYLHYLFIYNKGKLILIAEELKISLTNISLL